MMKKDNARKERYFNAEEIGIKARQMVDQGSFLHRRRVADFSPFESALLILDMQAYFLTAHSHAFIPSAPTILPGLVKLQDAYATAGLPIIFTRHINSLADAGMMSTWWRELITADDPMSQLVPELDSTLGSVVVKTQYDAFHGTDLEARLQHNGVRQVVIGGVMTHLCCETTARAAFMRGYHVFFLVDGTATYTEAFHRATLLNLWHGFGTPVLVDEILVTLGGSQ